MNVTSKTILPIWSHDDEVTLFDYYLDSVEQVLAQATSDVEYIDLFKQTNKYLGEDLYILEVEEIRTDETIQAEINKTIQTGSNMFLPYSSLPNNVSASFPISDSSLLANATAGKTIDTADIIWQFVDGGVEGAWLKDSSAEFVETEVRIKLNSGITELRFPYPDRGRVAEGLDWTGKGVDNDTQDLYISQDERLMAPIVDKLYWEDTTELSSAHDLTLFRSNLVANGATASKNIRFADTITMLPHRDAETGIEFAWLYKFERMEFPIHCGSNNFQFPLFTQADGKYPFVVPRDYCSPVMLDDVATQSEMCGSIGGRTIADADWILKKNGECGVATEGAWLRGTDLAVDYGGLYGDGSTQSSFSGVFPSGVPTPFLWEFETIEANHVFNGYDHDKYCEYNKLPALSSIIDPEPTAEFIGWNKCNCKAVFYSPMGNPKGDFDKYEEFYDVIYEDMGDIPFAQSTWVDSNGDDYKHSKNFGYFEYKGVEPDVGFGKGEWLTYNGDTLNLVEGKSYFYVRASLGGCGEKPPCFVVNSCRCNPDCASPIWIKMVLDKDGAWVDTGEFTDLEFEAGSFYEYIRRGSRKYKFNAPDPDGEGSNPRKWVNRSTPLPSFSFNIPIYNADPYWAKSVNVLGMEMGITPVDTGRYLKTIQPPPSDLVFYDDAYIRYKHVGCDPLIWVEDMKFNVDLHLPAIWKQLKFNEYQPELLQKIVGCGKCELVFDSDPKGCKVRESNCDSYFATIEVTDINSTMNIHSPENCDGMTEVFYQAQKAFNWIGDVTVVSYSAKSVDSVKEFAIAQAPWGNLLNQHRAEIKVHEGGELLLTSEAVGLMKPDKLGLLKIECFNMKNALDTYNV